jgi:hypothetical protein
MISVAHFALWLTSAVLARGWDLDHISSRSTASRAAETVDEVLSFPHDALLHNLLSRAGWSVPLIVGVMVVSSLLWGLALCGVWHLLRRSAFARTAAGARSL